SRRHRPAAPEGRRCRLAATPGERLSGRGRCLEPRRHQDSRGRRRSTLRRLWRARRDTRPCTHRGIQEDATMRLSRRAWRTGIASLLLGTSVSAFALDTVTIAGSALSLDCIAYRVRGICFWLRCTFTGCSLETSVRVEHYVPDAVVSSYSNTGENPWVEVRAMSMPNPTAQGGGDGTTNEEHENNLAKFKNADVI